MFNTAIIKNFFIIILFTSLSNVNAAEEVYFPLTIGSSWQYKVTMASGFQYDTREEIIGTEIINGKVAYQKAYYDYSYQNGTVIDDYSLFYSDENHVYYLGANQVSNPSWNEGPLGLTLLSSPYPKIQLEFLNDAGKQKFSAEFIQPNGNRLSVWVETEYLGAEKITVPAGTFSDCHKFQETFSDGISNISWYCSGVGLAKEEEYDNGQYSEKQELVSYSFSSDESEPIDPLPPTNTNIKFHFERVWPAKQQQWNFDQLTAGAVSDDGIVYLVDYLNNLVQVFNQDGRLINSFGGFGVEKGKFNRPFSIALDHNQQIYISDMFNNRIQVFDRNGHFIREWGGTGQGAGQLFRPTGITVDKQGRVYVVDMGNYRIQVFSSEGEFITQWGSKGVGNGQFGGNATWQSLFDLEVNGPMDIAVSDQGRVYVADTWNRRVQVFTVDGNYIEQFNSGGEHDTSGFADNEYPTAITIDSDENIYLYIGIARWGKVATFNRHGQFKSVQELNQNALSNSDLQDNTPSGLFISANRELYVVDNSVRKYSFDGAIKQNWWNGGSGKNEFNKTGRLVVDDVGQVYVVDQGNKRIQVFDKEGLYLRDLEAPLGGFEDVTSIAFNTKKHRIYVASRFSFSTWGIRSYNINGQFIGELATGKSDSQFISNVATDKEGNYYLTLPGSYQGSGDVYVFSEDGRLLKQLHPLDPETNEGYYASAIAISDSGVIYIVSAGSYEIRAYSPNGEFLFEWGGVGSADGSFNGFGPSDIDIDSDGNVYVTDQGNHRIQVFTAEGVYLTQFGQRGSGPGGVVAPQSLALGGGGRLYVADLLNRIQLFRSLDTPINTKAIVVAAGGPYPGNTLWNATQMNANFAYWTLLNKGFLKDDIYYLSSNQAIDLDFNGLADDVDADVTSGNLQHAIEEWAADAENVVIYLTDHGGDKSFRLSGDEILSAEQLDTWLDQLQQTLNGQLTVVYDACLSGSFISELTPDAGKKRVVISSSKADENAYFLSQGSVSFSNFFWTHIFNGESVYDAFRLGSDSLSVYQTPLLDANGNGIANEVDDLNQVAQQFIGNAITKSGDLPIISSIVPEQSLALGGDAILWAQGVADSDGISRVWAVVRPPNFQPGSATNPVEDLPTVELNKTREGYYEGVFSNFTIPGNYQITIYALDSQGNTASPQQTAVKVESILKRKAIIAVGEGGTEAETNAFINNAEFAYLALIRQGYSDENIYYLSPNGTQGVDGESTIANLNYALSQWSLDNSQDMVLFLIGNQQGDGFKLSTQETIGVNQLASSLDQLQNSLPGLITVIVEGSLSGEMLSILSNDKRIVVTSTATDQAAHFINAGDMSFSRVFWNKILHGANIRDAFVHANNSVTAFGNTQTPQLDDNGNGLGNDGNDGRLARSHILGQGVFVAEDEPQITTLTAKQTLVGTNTAGLWLNVSSVTTITEAYAVITRPDNQHLEKNQSVMNLPIVPLNCNENSCLGQYDCFDLEGQYSINFYAKDQFGNFSDAVGIVIEKKAGQPPFSGAYYDDQSGILRMYQLHAAGKDYFVELRNIGANVFVVNALNTVQQTDGISDGEYYFDQQQLKMPKVHAFGQDFNVEMQHGGDWRFYISNVYQ